MLCRLTFVASLISHNLKIEHTNEEKGIVINMKKLSQSRLADAVINGRKDKSMTQAQLADETGINRSLISRIEQKDFIPSIEQLESLSDVLSFDLTDMFINANTSKLESPSPLNIAVAGTGYVGLSIATLLAQHNHVTAVDIIPEKVDLINSKKSPIQDDYIEKYLAEKELDLTATLDGESAYKNADFVVLDETLRVSSVYAGARMVWEN